MTSTLARQRAYRHKGLSARVESDQEKEIRALGLGLVRRSGRGEELMLLRAFSREGCVRRVNCGKKLGSTHRLRQVRDDAGRHAAFAHGGVGIGGDDDRRDSDALVGEGLLNLQAAHLWHLQVKDQTFRKTLGQRV